MSLFHRPVHAVLIACALFSSGAASAAAISDFNLIAFGNVTGTSLVEGRSAIFGNLSGNSKTFVTSTAGLADPVGTAGLGVNDGLLIGGSASGGPMNVNNGADVRVAGSGSAGSINPNGGQETFNDAGVSPILDALETSVLSMENFFDARDVNSTVNLSDLNRVVFNATPVDGIAVFEVGSTQLFHRNGQFDLTGDLSADLFLIRVTGGSDINTSGLNPKSFEFNDPTFQSRIAFYFPDASASTDLRFNGGLGGALLARQANLIVTNPLEGTVVAGNVTLNSGVHLPVFTVVPEPGTALLMGLGLAGLAAIRRP
ncbi:MAG: collagen-binding domain-containing protein [Myxococcota bacterium]